MIQYFLRTCPRCGSHDVVQIEQTRPADERINDSDQVALQCKCGTIFTVNVKWERQAITGL
jgi:hypothetical protein